MGRHRHRVEEEKTEREKKCIKREWENMEKEKGLNMRRKIKNVFKNLQ